MMGKANKAQEVTRPSVSDRRIVIKESTDWSICLF
jgi:hypothetical protein